MSRTFLPSRESDLVIWTTSFQSTIVSAASDYGLTDTQAGDYTTTQSAFVSAHQVANDPMTRSPGNIEAKNTAKDALITMTRELVDICQASPVMDNDKRKALGVTIRDNTPTPVPVPKTSPNIDILSVVGWTVELRLHNEDSTKRARPDGVKGATVFSYVGETPPTSVDDWKFEGNISKTETKVHFPSTLAAGTKVWVTAFWFNTTSQSGPAAAPVSTNLQGGTVAKAA
ncbi:hypothetical protein OT109_11915 [Phycisphaeraceae bacterium D3-23]